LLAIPQSVTKSTTTAHGRDTFAVTGRGARGALQSRRAGREPRGGVQPGQPGWAAIVPIYNIIVMLQIAKKPLWWIVLFLIPIANFVIAILVAIEIAKKFNQSTGFGIGMAFLPFVFYPMLGFGSATYRAALPAS
jgi:hypothetical protein